MVHFNRRRVRTRRFARPSKPPQDPLPPIELDASNGASTEFAVEAVQAQSAPRSSDSTVELQAVRPQADPNEETQEAFSGDKPPEPPDKMEFTCPCGTNLIATYQMYDKHTRCGMCQTVLLVNLVYDAEHRSHEIVPFRVNP